MLMTSGRAEASQDSELWKNPAFKWHLLRCGSKPAQPSQSQAWDMYLTAAESREGSKERNRYI